MALKYKKVETVFVSLNEELNFSNLLIQSQDKMFNDGSGKLTNLKILENNESIVRGAIITTKQTGIPPKHNPTTQVFSILPIDEHNGEGLGFSNVFVYDKEFKILMYEFNKNGCYLTSFAKMIKKISQPHVEEILIKIEFAPVLRKEAYERMLNFQIYKSLEVKIANPSKLSKEFLEENDALSRACQASVEMETDVIDLKFSMRGRRIDKGMKSQVISKFINKVQTFIGIKNDNIEKFSIKGYRQDDSETGLIKDEIDILLDTYTKSFRIDEPNVQGDPQTVEKSLSLYSLYISCKPDLKMFTSYGN